eukprot:230048-Hanusia_phi.AAC.1
MDAKAQSPQELIACMLESCVSDQSPPARASCRDNVQALSPLTATVSRLSPSPRLIAPPFQAPTRFAALPREARGFLSSVSRGGQGRRLTQHLAILLPHPQGDLDEQRFRVLTPDGKQTCKRQ